MTDKGEIRGKTILIIEDEEPMLFLLHTVLSLHGAVLLHGRNGAEALSMMKKSIPDLILTDLNMPNVGGLEFLKNVRLGKGEIPVIAMSGRHELLSIAVDLGANDILKKPFDADELLTKVRTALEKHHS